MPTPTHCAPAHAPRQRGRPSTRALATRLCASALFASAIALAPVVAAGGTAQDDGLTPRERRGKDIYFGLTAPSPTITARVGTPPIELASSVLACANCHGTDGRGKPEGQVVPSNITWEALTKPYGVTHAGGRRHPPYTERLLVRAIGLGIDPAGNRLQAAMPRFQMPRADADALTAYLKRLSTDAPPGISDSAIRIGTLVPATGPFADAGRAVAAALRAYFDSLNAQGGIYGRMLELRVASVDTGADGSPAGDTTTGVAAFLDDAAPFALVGSLLPDADAKAMAQTEARGIPLVGPLMALPDTSSPGRTTFYLLSGAEQQAGALLDFQRSRAAVPSVSMVYTAAVVPAAMVDRIRAQGEQRGWRIACVNLEGSTARAVARELKRSAVTHALLLASGPDVLALATELAAAEWTPTLLVPGSLATDDLLRLPSTLIDRTFIALPSVPSDLTPAALEEYRALAIQHRLPATAVTWHLAAIGSATVLAQGLKRAGRGVTRATLVSALEGLTDFDSGWMPRLRFGRGRHIGASGAYIVTLDPARTSFRQVTGWLPVSDAQN
jgi:ABC-type branched-subunit amino acid transport system substrate-binding protein